MQNPDISRPAQGAYTSLPQLIALRFPAARLQLTRRNRALSKLAGPNKSNFRGRGIDFEEVRNYQPGDDIRSIDWRVTARTGTAHTKLFREERERPVLVAVDQRTSMFFGSRYCFKSVLAAQLGALIAWSALQGNDRVGGLVFNDSGHQDVRPRRSRRTVLALLSLISEYNAQLPLDAGGNSFTQMLVNLRRVARPGSSVFIVSDFRGADSDGAGEQLFELAKHTEITALSCTDPLESALPRGGRYAVTDGRSRATLDTADTRLRRKFIERFESSRQQLSSQLLRLGIPLLEVSTDTPAYDVLSTYYGGRRA